MAFFFVMRGMVSFFVTRGMAFFFRYEEYGLLFSLYLTFSRVKGHLKAPILLEGFFANDKVSFRASTVSITHDS